MSSEISFACCLANPRIRGIITPYLQDIEWQSKLAQHLIEFHSQMPTDGGDTRPMAELQAWLSSQGCIETEIFHIRELTLDFLRVQSDESINRIVSDFQRFYHSKLLTKIFSKQQTQSLDIEGVLNEIRLIRDVESFALPFVDLSKVDVSEMIQRELGGQDSLPSSFDFIRSSTPYKGYLRGQVVQVVGPPGAGKSMFLANEALEALQDGHKVYYVALGDMMHIDFIVRLASLITGKSLSEVSIAPSLHFNDKVRKILEDLRITVMPSGTVTIHALKEFLEAQVVPVMELDLFILDYDANLLGTQESMYEEGEVTYNILSSIARPPGRKYRVVMVACQPKIQYWALEELPKESSGESSRKQAIVDLMVTMGKSPQIKQCHAGVMKVAKVRRGKENVRTSYQLLDNGRIEEITRENYAMLKTFEG